MTITTLETISLQDDKITFNETCFLIANIDFIQESGRKLVLVILERRDILETSLETELKLFPKQ